METRGTQQAQHTFRSGSFYRSIALIFGLQLLAVVIIAMMGMYNVAPLPAVIVLIVIVCLLGWLAARRHWKPVMALAHIMGAWNEQKPDLDALSPERLPRRTDAEVATLARGLHGFASRISNYSQRERNFTRDASHELRSPLTVIKMSADMLADEAGLSEFGQRSVQRIKRATREMESLVEALLILARESDQGVNEEDFVINDVLRLELDEARELLKGRPITLQLDEPTRFALHGSRRVFSVLCWQLIRNACQQTEQGLVVITVLPGEISVTNRANAGEETPSAVDRHGFELAIARRISERFAWPLELQTREKGEHVARIRFPHPLPAS